MVKLIIFIILFAHCMLSSFSPKYEKVSGILIAVAIVASTIYEKFN